MEKMRLMVLVDMPASTRHERKVAREFADFLFGGGFVKLQESVYTRIADGRSSASLHARRVRDHAPEFGMVRMFVMTERQFAGALLVAGEEDAQELEIGSQQDIFL